MFMEQFAFDPHALVNFVGGGGKTALIRSLMREYAALGPALCTTTTRIHPPDTAEGFAVLSSDNTELLQQLVESAARCRPGYSLKLLVTRSYMSPTLMRGLPPDFNNALDRGLFLIFLNEADGAASYSLKMTKDSEPVLMENAQYLVPVVGLDCLGAQIGSEAIFRWEKFVEHFPGIGKGRVTPRLAADVLMHAQGVCKGWAPGMKIIPFINKVDQPGQEAAARDLARRILDNGQFPVERVLFGSAIHGRAESMLPK